MTSKSKKRMLWIALPLVAVMGAGAAAAGYKYSGEHRGPERMVERINDRLDLTVEQKQKLEAVKEALIEGSRIFRREHSGTMEKIIAEVRKSEMDEDRILDIIEERTSRIDVIAPRVVGPVVDFHKSLDDVQREKVLNLLEAMRDWGWGRRGGHG